MRDAIAKLIAPLLTLTGFRFGKDYRWGSTAYHRAVFAVINTTLANLKAGEKA